MKKGPAVSTRKRRSRSVEGERWLDHRPATTLDTDTIFQPQMGRTKSITKLVDQKDVTDAKISKYVLTTQEQVRHSLVTNHHLVFCNVLVWFLLQDSAGEIETKLYKGDVLTTVGGGAQVFREFQYSCSARYLINLNV